MSQREPTLFQMSAPLVVSFVMRAAFTFVDTIYAATIGDSAVAAIGLTVPFEFLMIAIWVGMSTGLTAALSKSMAAGEGEKIEQYLSAAWRMALIVSPVFVALGAFIWFVAPQYCLSDEVFGSFRIYAAVMLGGSAFTAFWSVVPDSVVKAHQDTRSTMWAGIASNVINLLLNTIFLFVFHWGIFGIAFSTVLGRVGGLVYALNKAKQHEDRRRAAGTHTVPGNDPTPYWRQLSLALPAGLTFVLTAVEMAIINGMLAGLGTATAAIAAYSIYHRVLLFAMNPLIAMSVAMLPFASRLVGKQDWDGLRQGIRQSLLATAAYSVVVVGPLMVLLGPWLASALAESAETVDYARFALFLVPAACLLSTPFFLMRPVFEAMGRGQPGLIMAVVRTGILTVPLAILGIRVASWLGYPQIYGMLIGLLVVALLSSMAFVLWLRRALRDFIDSHLLLEPAPAQPGASVLLPDTGLQPEPPE